MNRQNWAAVGAVDDPATFIATELDRHGFATAARHFRAAEDAFKRESWEAANAQVRTYLEALFDGVATVVLGVALTGGAARKRLQSEGLLTERQGNFLRGFMELAGEAGSHAGVSEPRTQPAAG